MKYKQTVYHQNKVEKIKIQTDCCSLSFFFARLLHAKPKHASGKTFSRLVSIPYGNHHVVVYNRARKDTN